MAKIAEVDGWYMCMHISIQLYSKPIIADQWKVLFSKRAMTRECQISFLILLTNVNVYNKSDTELNIGEDNSR